MISKRRESPDLQRPLSLSKSCHELAPVLVVLPGFALGSVVGRWAVDADMNARCGNFGCKHVEPPGLGSSLKERGDGGV
jgi:hypothetical protein